MDPLIISTRELQLALQALRIQMLRLQPVTQESLPQLSRLAVQTDYLVQRWPEAQWPTADLNGIKIPSREHVVAALQRIQYLCIPAHVHPRHDVVSRQQIYVHLENILQYFL